MSVVASQLRATLSKAQARRTFVAAEEERHEEAPLNGHQFTAAGGQLDFVRGAYASRGGKSVIAFASTTRGATISKIVPRLSGPVTTPRNEVHYVATEYGIENLKGLSSTDRAVALVGLAHPDYRRRLTGAAQTMHVI